MTTLGDAPAGAKFIADLVEAIQTLALIYANTPDMCAVAHLEGYLQRIEPHVVDAVGGGPAVKLLKTFRGTVMGEKHRIEASGSASKTRQ